MDLFQPTPITSNVNIGTTTAYADNIVPNLNPPTPIITGIPQTPQPAPFVPIFNQPTPLPFAQHQNVAILPPIPTNPTLKQQASKILPMEVYRLPNEPYFVPIEYLTGFGSVSSFNSIFANNISSGNIITGGLEADTLSTIHFYADIVNIDEATISSISTNAIELDGAYLNVANGTEVLLNGIPIATTANLSSIQDWAIFPAVSTITPINNNINIGAINNRFQTGYFSTIVAQTAILESTTLTLTETLSSQFINVLFASTINAGVVNGNVGNFSTINVSTLNSINAPTINISTFTGGSGNFSTINAQRGNISTLFARTGQFSTLNVTNLENVSTLSVSTITARQGNFTNTNTSGGAFTQLSVNQTATLNNVNVSGTLNVARVEAVSTIRGNRAEFSTMNVMRLEQVSTIEANRGLFSTLSVRRVEDVQTLLGDVGTFSTLRANTYLGIPSTISGSNWSQYKAISDVDFDTYDLNNCGDIDCGNINSLDINCVDVDAGDIVCDNLQVGSAITGLADVEIYGSTALPGDSALYVEGGVEFQGGLIHGFSAGALPVLGVNTQRFSLTPAGIAVISPTFITLDSGSVMNQAVGGAYSLAVGGVGSLAFGTYCEIDSGLLKLVNNTPIIFSANTGTGNPGGLNLNTYTTSNSLAIDSLPFGALEKYKAPETFVVSSGTGAVFLESVSLPRIGQWQVKTDFLITKNGGGNANNTDASLYYAPSANPIPSAFSQCIFGAPMYAMPSSQYLTINAPVVISTITGYTSSITSTITTNFSTFLSTGQTFSTFTSSFFSSIVADGGLNLFWDGSQSQNSFTATLQRGSFYASYLGGYIPPA